MTKQTFLDTLRGSLTGAISASAVEENVRYYEEYINSQIRMGKSEQQVLAELGNPRLIARSIIDAGKSTGDTSSNAGAAYGGNGGGYYTGGYQNGGYQGTGYRSREQGEMGRSNVRKRRWPTWLSLILVLVLIVIFVILPIVVLFVWWLAPVVVIVWLITFVIKMMRKR